MKKVLFTLEISRPHNMIAAGAGVFAGYRLCGGRGLDGVLAPVVLAALVAGLGNLVNDYFDAEIDRVNKPRRPIPSGRLSRRFVAWVYGIGSACIAVAMIRWLPPPILALTMAWHVLLFYYAARAKRIALLGNLVISSVCASAFLAGALAAGSAAPVAFPIVFAFVFVLARELVKGAEDVPGDRSAGARTLAVLFGAERTARWGAVLLCLCAAAAPVPAVAGDFSRWYGLVMVLLFAPGVLAAARLALASPSRSAFHRASWILKAEMFVGIVAVGLGRAG